MEFTARQIAEYTGGRVEGDADVRVSSFSKIEDGRPGSLSFLSNPKYTHYLYETEASIVLVNEDMRLTGEVSATLVRVKNAYDALARLLQLYEKMKPKKSGVDALAFVHPSARLGANVYVGAFAYIGERAVIGAGALIYPHAVIGDDVTIGCDTIIYSNVTIYDQCVIGSRVTLHSGSVIGADGFGFAPTADGYDKIPQIGIVEIEDDVEIGANTCVDRSTMGRTRIGRGVKLDNLIQVAHNVEIGENTVMAAQVGIAGSTKVGRWCMIGGQVGMPGHIHVADKTRVGGKAGVIGDVKTTGQALIGYPAVEYRTYLKYSALLPRLPEMYKDLAELKKEIEKLRK